MHSLIPPRRLRPVPRRRIVVRIGPVATLGHLFEVVERFRHKLRAVVGYMQEFERVEVTLGNALVAGRGGGGMSVAGVISFIGVDALVVRHGRIRVG